MQRIAQLTLLVHDYEAALAFYVGCLGFEVLEDSDTPKRRVVIAPSGSGCALVLAEATRPEVAAHVGNQAGGKVWLFLHTDDFWRDYKRYVSAGVSFLETPREEVYGTVAVFEDLYGNRWDLLEPCEETA